MTPQEALTYLVECRDSHVEWAEASDSPDALFDADDAKVCAGTPAFHADCVADYQQVLDALAPLVEAWTADEELRAMWKRGELVVDRIPDIELPGLWERADFEGGQDEPR